MSALLPGRPQDYVLTEALPPTPRTLLRVATSVPGPGGRPVPTVLKLTEEEASRLVDAGLGRLVSEKAAFDGR